MINEQLINLTTRLKALRQERKISLRKMSKLSGLTKAVICKFENHRTANPRLATIYKYCMALDLEIKVFEETRLVYSLSQGDYR